MATSRPLGARRVLLSSALIVLLAAGAARATSPEAEAPDTPVSVGVHERVTVHATRLPDRTEPADTVPAHVTVLTAEDLARSGARTLQDALALEAGVAVYDQVGNDAEKTLDLRGFAGGSGTAVYVDGARVNDPRNNAAALELIPIEAVERVEVTRGAAAGLAGGGSEAGVIHVTTRAGARGGRLEAAGGSDGARRASGRYSGTLGPVELSVGGGHERTDGFRENTDGRLSRFAAHAGLPLPAGGRVELTASLSRLDFGAPGALTEAELAADPESSPFNRLDRDRHRAGLAVLAYRGPAGTATTLSANVYARRGDSDALTTGRGTALFGGFFLEAETDATGAAVQATRSGRLAGVAHDATVGAEWSDGRVDARGWFTSPDDPSAHDPSSPDSANRTDRRTVGLFARESVRVGEAWTVHAGLRLDRDRVGYDERTPDPTLRDARTFSETTWRGGVAWTATARTAAWASWAQSFLPPTAEQLFAFPLFGSNPGLDPEVSRAWELGWRHRRGDALELTAAGFRIDTRDEIVFDPDAGGVFGANVNAGETRRRGVELSARGRATPRLGWSARAASVDAEFSAGESAGKTVPLVPRVRLSAGLDVALPARVRLHADALHVGRQVLDNDDANAQARLDAYTVVNARAEWRLGGETGASVFLEARNLFDERYATRGIHAFDFATSSPAVFLTPAPGRRFLGGAAWTF